MLSLTGDRNLTLDTMRDVNDQFVGFDVNINDYSAGIIFGKSDVFYIIQLGVLSRPVLRGFRLGCKFFSKKHR